MGSFSDFEENKIRRVKDRVGVELLASYVYDDGKFLDPTSAKGNFQNF